MNTKERNFSNTLKKYFMEQHILIDKIESRITTAGVPDLLLCGKNTKDIMAELKVIEADCKLSLTPGQVSWHSKRNLYSNTHPFICLVEEQNKMLVINSRKVIEIIKSGGIIDFTSVPDQCLILRNREGYMTLIDMVMYSFYSSQRVYK